MKKGFTLAEVLITLGIIGVVAAMTMPALIANHRRSVIETSLKKFSSIVSQTYRRMQYDNGSLGTSLGQIADYIDKDDPAGAENLINEYYKPYMEMIDVVKGQYGAFAYLKDGSAFYLRRLYDTDKSSNLAGTYLFFCPKARICKELNEGNDSLSEAAGKSVFVFYFDGNVAWAVKNYTRDELKDKCKDRNRPSNEFCTALIIYDGWKISKDYPHRI